jgi:hypothetical protein
LKLREEEGEGEEEENTEWAKENSSTIEETVMFMSLMICSIVQMQAS